MSSTLFGDKSRFAMEVEESPSTGNRQLRRIDIWATNCCLTCDDHHVYIPQFADNLRSDLCRLHNGWKLEFPVASPQEAHRRCREDHELGSHYGFLEWGPTTDSVVAYAFHQEQDLFITFEFWRATHGNPNEKGRVFVAKTIPGEVQEILHQVLTKLA